MKCAQWIRAGCSNNRFVLVGALVMLKSHPIDQQLPVVNDRLDSPFRKSGQVVHDGVNPAVPVRSFTAVGQNSVILAQGCCFDRFDSEPLDEDAVDAVLLHPLKMTQHGIAV